MGNLVETYVLKQKEDFVELIHDQENQLIELSKSIPLEYHEMFQGICGIINLNQIMEVSKNDHVLYLLLRRIADRYAPLLFDSRFRETCLKSLIRKAFYDTLLIVENDCNEMKFDCYVIVDSHSKIITESQLVELTNK